jgi:hypothetical protein
MPQPNSMVMVMVEDALSMVVHWDSCCAVTAPGDTT